MDGSIDRSDVGPYVLAGIGRRRLDEFGLGNPAATCHTPRPGEGRDGDTGRLGHARWCL